MIDIEAEKLISLTNACELLPRRRGGVRPHFSTLWRWARVGLRGVKLETIKVGGTLCTSREALQRFCQRLSEEDEQRAAGGSEGHRTAGGDELAQNIKFKEST